MRYVIVKNALKVQVIWDAYRDLVPFVQFKKHEKHPRKSVTGKHTSVGVFHVF